MKIMHVTIQTEKAEEERAFFENYVGLKIQNDLRPFGKDIVFYADSEGATEIEIVKRPGASESGNENLSIGFQAGNLHELRTQLVKDGFNPSPMISPMPQVEFFVVKDPAGVNIQFL